MDENNFSAATSRDLSRPDATYNDTDFTLSLEEVAERYARAGHPRTLRSLQRYCANGHLDARKIATTTGDKYLVTPQSVARHIAQIEEFAPLETVATLRDLSRPVALTPAPENPPHSIVEPAPAVEPAATEPDTPRPVATEPATTGETSRYVAHLEQQLEVARDERDFLREQIDRKDKTIDALIERDRETNFLVRGLQEMLTPLLGGRRREEPPQTHTQ